MERPSLHILAVNWWLPPNHSVHGADVDGLFAWIFWIAVAVFVLVQAALVVFLVRYRSRPGRRGVFTHGNARLELAWTVAPAVILAVLSLASKRVWDDYRSSPAADDPDKAVILVIAQQFQWNVVYPGPDGKLGRYLVFPKPTDTHWPGGEPFANVDGPAQLPHDAAMVAVNSYILQENPLGKDFNDPAGKDDDWTKLPGRPITVPADRPVEIHLTSLDVIHSFFLPEFRVKLDAVPGMTGKIYFTATATSASREAQTSREYTLDELTIALNSQDLRARITDATPGASQFKQGRIQYWRYVDAGKKTIVRDGGPLRPEMVDKLRAVGIDRITAHQSGEWEVACAELCGIGHSRMRGTLVVLDPAEYAAKFETSSGKASAQADSAR